MKRVDFNCNFVEMSGTLSPHSRTNTDRKYAKVGMSNPEDLWMWSNPFVYNITLQDQKVESLC